MGRPKGSKNKRTIIVQEMSVPKEEVKILTVELSPEDQQLLHDEGARQAVPSLAAHPGFRHLNAKLRALRSYYRANFEQHPPIDFQSASNLQAAIFWTGWLENQITDLIPTMKPAQLESTPDSEVAELFKRAKANLVAVGVKES